MSKLRRSRRPGGCTGLLPLWIGPAAALASETDGIFYPLVGPEAYVSKGMTIGYVTDYFGKRIWDAKSPGSERDLVHLRGAFHEERWQRCRYLRDRGGPDGAIKSLRMRGRRNH